MTTDARLVDVVGEDHYSCGGTCPLSRNVHVHFPEGWDQWLAKLELAIAQPPAETPPKADPFEELQTRWRAAFATVWGELKTEAGGDPTALIRAAEVALELARR